MKIDCITAQKMIQPYLDRNLDDREASVFIAHVRHCPVCREELETAFLVDHALTFLDKDSSDSFDIARMVRDDLKEYERGMLLRSILNMLIWLGIALMTIVIFIILLRYIAPGVFRVSRADADPTGLPAISFDVAFSGPGLTAVVAPTVTSLTIPAGAASVLRPFYAVRPQAPPVAKT